MNRSIHMLVFGFALGLAVCAGAFSNAEDPPAASIELFDGKSLTGWEHYLVEPKLKMSDVWSVRDGLLICKGKPMGYLATKKNYTNYRLIVEWRWAPGKPASNSGVLMRITGKPRALPKCAEAQLKAGSAGDVYGFHGFSVKGDADRTISSEGDMIGKLAGVTKIKANEKKPGEWNQYDITLKDEDVVIKVNGEIVNEATGLTIVPGKIGLQSEGGEIHFRTVRMIPLSATSAATPSAAASPETEVTNDVAPKAPMLAAKPGMQIPTSTEVTVGKGSSAETATIHYLLSLPSNYEQVDNSPLIIFLHGRGEWGSDLERVKFHGPPKILDKENRTPFVVVSPQTPRDEWWNVDKLSKLLDHVLATTKADPNRVYLTGLSMGGFGTWAWAALEPDRFAAAIPICGAGQPQTAAKLTSLPIWAFHGGKDRVVPLKGSQTMVDAIKQAGGENVKLTVYPDAGHDSWTKTYDNREIYDWLLEHKRAK